MTWRPLIVTVFIGLTARAGENPIAANFSQSEADAIAKKCGAPRDLLKVRDGQLLMWKTTGSNADASMCMMGEVRASGKLLHPVGNEMHAPRAPQ